MKLYKIAKIVNDIIGLKLPETYFSDNDTTASSNSVVAKIITCCNFVLEELYSDYATAISKTTVTVTNGVANTTALNLNRVISLVSADGFDAKYRYTENGLEVERDGTYNLTYAKLPQTMSWQSNVPLPSPRITERIYAYGVIAEYYSVVGDYDNARLWKNKFTTALQAASVKTSNLTMPVWRWF